MAIVRFYSIGEVAEMLGENPSLVRYWSNTFSKYLKLSRGPKGNRRYTQEDIDLLKRIYHLVNVERLTLEGVSKVLASDRRKVDKDVLVLDSLREIRKQLTEVRKLL